SPKVKRSCAIDFPDSAFPCNMTARLQSCHLTRTDKDTEGMKALAFVLLLLATPLALRAQSTVHGTVIDAQTGKPIVGAAVVVTGTRIGVVTDQGGAFTLTASDTITSVTASGVGYAAAETTVEDAARPLRVR